MKKEYEIIVASSDSSEVKRFSIKGWVVKLVLCLLAGLFLVVVFGVIFYGRVYFTALKVKRLEAENRKLKYQNMRIVELEKKVKRLEVLREKLYSMLGYDKAPEIKPFIDTSPNMEVNTNPQLSSTPVESEERYGFSPAMSGLLLYALREDSITPRGMPVKGVITRGYGPIHRAIDIGAAVGTPVEATAFGIVDSVYHDMRLGEVVVIRHDSEYSTLYGHLQNIRVYSGKRVKRGEVIGEVGLTGYTTGPHLHYEVRNLKGYLNPVYFLND